MSALASPSPGSLAPPARDCTWTEHDWTALELPPTWTDALSLRRPDVILRVLRGFFGDAPPVQLPPELPGAAQLPPYVLQSFHRMPNGYYSRNWVRGYATGFEASMLGRMSGARARLAGWLAGARRALDLGCGAGGLAGALLAAGVPEVIGLDPSPYLLREAARRHGAARFVQGLAESTGFPDGCFDAAGVCFVLHELPAAVAARAVHELARMLVPGARLAIVEPSPIQRHEWRPWRLLRAGGPAALYFAALARAAYEPCLDAWHGCDIHALLHDAGFALEHDESGVPFRFLLARRVPVPGVAARAPERPALPPTATLGVRWTVGSSPPPRR